MMFSTLKLDSSWDLSVDGLGNIATNADSDAVIQDVASSIRTVQGELFYDTTQGIPYFLSVLGQNFSPQLFGAYVEQSALSVPGVDQAQATIGAISQDRKLTGTVMVIDETGTSLNAHF